jgi:hypothetical protein
MYAYESSVDHIINLDHRTRIIFSSFHIFFCILKKRNIKLFSIYKPQMGQKSTFVLIVLHSYAERGSHCRKRKYGFGLEKGW